MAIEKLKMSYASYRGVHRCRSCDKVIAIENGYYSDYWLEACFSFTVPCPHCGTFNELESLGKRNYSDEELDEGNLDKLIEKDKLIV